MRTRQIGFHISRVLPRLLALCLCLLLASSATAQETFQFFKTYTPEPDSPPAKTLTLVTEDWQATFMPPDDCIVQLNREKRELWLTFADNRCQIKVQVSTNSPELLKPEYTNELENLVKGRYPNAAVSQADICRTRGGMGFSFDIQQWTVYKTKLSTRLALVPIPDGVLEISMSSSDAKFKSQLPAMSRVTHSLRIEKADLTRLSLRKD